jgi:hypothetical protein
VLSVSLAVQLQAAHRVTYLQPNLAESTLQVTVRNMHLPHSAAASAGKRQQSTAAAADVMTEALLASPDASKKTGITAGHATIVQQLLAAGTAATFGYELLLLTAPHITAFECVSQTTLIHLASVLRPSRPPPLPHPLLPPPPPDSSPLPATSFFPSKVRTDVQSSTEWACHAL